MAVQLRMKTANPILIRACYVATRMKKNSPAFQETTLEDFKVLQAHAGINLFLAPELEKAEKLHPLC